MSRSQREMLLLLWLVTSMAFFLAVELWEMVTQ